MTTIAPAEVSRLSRALPFWLSLTLVPIAIFGALNGGWTILLLPPYAWGLFALLDARTGKDPDNADPDTPEAALFWYKAVTLIWFPVQFCLLIWMLWYVPAAAHLNPLEKIGVFFGMGVVSGTVGINFSHELMHRKSRFERWLADLLLASVLYSHFRSEHLRVHHLYIGTPRDPVSARYNETFYHFFLRVLWQCPVSAWRAEAALSARKSRPTYHLSNPFWRYAALQGLMIALALSLGGGVGLGLFAYQAAIAVWQLELANYIEHYGLTRRHLGHGKYEHVLPRHSWNTDYKVSNWLLINLQRHSDHHYKPARRFPLLQTYAPNEAPQLPFGYPVMTLVAMFPPLWRRVMNKRVRAWRQTWYPDITDWKPYNKALNPLPR